MKTMKRVFALLLALTLLWAMGITAFAAEEKGSITIDNATVDVTYTIYRIFDLESYNAESGAYAYKVNDAWKNFAETLTDYVAVDAQGYVTWVEGADAAAFAKLALTYAKDNNIGNQGSQKATGTEVKFENLELGYYLVDSTLGALCSLNTTAPDAVIKDKNSKPDTEKKVEEDSTKEYGEKDDADIGQTVNFKTTISAKKGAENYILHDKMSKGLTFDENSVKVTVGGTELVADRDYELITSPTDGCTFEVQFKKDYLDSIEEDTEIVVSYSAVLNKDAVIADEGNPNETWLDYGDDNHTTHSVTKTYTWKVDVFKYTEEDGTKTPLENAKFTLSKNQNGSDPISLISLGENKYRVAMEGETGITEITTDNTGAFSIEGLDADTYYLTETQAPAGFNKLAGPVTIVIDNEGNTKVNSTTVEKVEVENKTGTELPSTGGIGTTIFYVIGGALVLGAAVLLITKKKMSAQ